MKDLIRVKSLISNEIEMLLNQQVKKEAYSSAVYLSMASWCNRNGYDFSSDYFFKQAEEERQARRRAINNASYSNSPLGRRAKALR